MVALAAPLGIPPERDFDGGEEPLPVDGLGQEIDRARLHRTHARRDVAMARQEDDGHRARVADESLLQLETVDARHVEIEHETGGHIVVCRFTLQKLAGRCVGMDVEVRSAQHARQRGSHGLVVVHDVYDPAAGRGLFHRLTFRES